MLNSLCGCRPLHALPDVSQGVSAPRRRLEALQNAKRPLVRMRTEGAECKERCGVTSGAARGRSAGPGWPARACSCRPAAGCQLGELGHLGRHVHVADARLGRRQVLLVGRQVVQTVLEAVLDRAEVATGVGDVLDRRCRCRRPWTARPSSSAAFAVVASLMAVSSDRPPVPAEPTAPDSETAPRRDGLAVVGADLEREAASTSSSSLPLNFVSSDDVLDLLAIWATSARDRRLVVGRQRAVARTAPSGHGRAAASSAPR